MLINPGSSRLHASTIAIDDPGSLMSFVTPGGAAFGRQDNLFVALGEISRIETDSVAEAAQWWDDVVSRLENETEMPGQFGIGPLAYGSFLFDPAGSSQKSVLIIPETIIGRRNGQHWLTRIGYDRVVPTLPERQAPPQPPVNLRYEDGQLNETEWLASVREAIATVRSHDLDKVVMARDVVGIADEPIDPRWPLTRLAAEYADCWSFMIDGLVGATPELLARREEGLTAARVLAGTTSRIDGVDDTQQAARLIASHKDLREHRMAVASVVESLRPHMRAMHVPPAPYVLTLPGLMHLATDITGVSDPDVNTLALAGYAHPTAAVCGTPTADAAAYIRDHERLDRGRYAGPVGWVDAQGDGEWALALRCGRIDPVDPTRISLFAGAGVVAESRAHSEYVETESKLRPMKHALRA